MSYWYMSTVPVTMLVPFLVALIHLKRLPAYAVPLILLLVLSGITQLGITFLAEGFWNNMPLFHLYTPVELLLLLWFFNRLIGVEATGYLVAIGAGFVVFAVLNALYIQNLFEFNSYARSIEALVVIALCFAYLGRQFRTDGLSYKDAGLWFVLGLFVYFASSFGIFVISNLSLSLDRYFDWIMWNVHATIVLVMYAFYTIGFVRCAR